MTTIPNLKRFAQRIARAQHVDACIAVGTALACLDAIAARDTIANDPPPRPRQSLMSYPFENKPTRRMRLCAAYRCGIAEHWPKMEARS